VFREIRSIEVACAERAQEALSVVITFKQINEICFWCSIELDVRQLD
tara:strand:- start:4137 stop:4277 length:141 start_codon:yes stop_codon:yes gene_type:complete